MSMSKEEWEFFDSCDSFKNYANIDEYKTDVRRRLTLSSWHYSEEEANKLTKEQSSYIERAYANGEPAADAGAEVGYCCG